MRVAIYASDEQEEPETQLAVLRAWCAAGGHEIVGEYVDRGVAADVALREPPARRRFNALLDAAQQRRFDLVLAWSLWQFSREGFGTADILQRLAAAGVGFHSYSEPLLSTDNERDVLLTVMTSLVAQERAWHSEQTKVGMQRARERGRPIGRARIPAAKEAAIRAALAEGVGMIRVARQVRVAPATVHRVAHEEPREVAAASRVPVSDIYHRGNGQKPTQPLARPAPVARGPVWR
jgi:DNA invertase Pin-like site-specific DNA recombinase